MSIAISIWLELQPENSSTAGVVYTYKETFCLRVLGPQTNKS